MNANEPHLSQLPSSPQPPLIALVGPTAVGKTALSLALARQYDGEIISADSRQIYRGMDIGTAKATPAERAQAPHHLIDVRDPDQTLTLAEYQERACAAIESIHARGKLPLLVGGTGLYVRAVTQGLRIPTVAPDPVLRAHLESQLAAAGLPPLVERLTHLDPATAAVIDLRNPRRVLRALEIVLITGKSKTELEGAEPPPWRMLLLCLTRARATLYQRIDERVDAMIDAGLVEETRALHAQYDPALPALSSLGYREIGAYLRGEMTLAAVVERIKLETHRYVRQQETFFRKLPGVEWMDMDAISAESIMSRIGEFLALPHR